jgi:uncharacterized FlaG/YvyC family protein
MNFNIGSVGSAGVTPVQGSGAARNAKASSAKPVDEAAVVVETFPSSPPDDVRAAMATASASYDKLQSADRHISFRIDDRSGRLQIQVHDLNGNVLFDLPPDKALKAADDGTVD